jgi:hypothetical protein
MINFIKIILISALFQCILIANTKSEKMARLFVNTLEKVESIIGQNPEVTEYHKAIHNHIIFDRYDHTITKKGFINSKYAYIKFYQKRFCIGLKPIMNYGVIIKVNLYDKYNDYVFGFNPKCKL